MSNCIGAQEVINNNGKLYYEDVVNPMSLLYDILHNVCDCYCSNSSLEFKTSSEIQFIIR
jgi:hypothetical protein